jgi:beta-hydroxylase
MAQLLAPQLLVLYALVGSAAYVHVRGRERLRLSRQILDHSTFLAPYNVLLYAFSGVPNKPVLPVETFPELKTISDNWQTIREEAIALFDEGRIRASTGNNDWGFYSFFRSGWKRFYLKWYDDPLPSAKHLCPKTVALVQSIPSIKGAMFTVLPPGSKLGGHRDPFAGSLRYHLGLVTPNSEDCRIVVDGVTCSYYDGKGFVFDETFIHWAENKTDKTRIIFFCDVERPMSNGIMRRINHWVNTHIVKISQSPNVEGEKVGGLNVVFSYLFEIHQLGRRMKNWNRKAYYALKYTVMAGVIGLIVLSAI